jgi:hypothetical protein
MYQPFPFQDPPKFTQIWIFCLKINHLATLETMLSASSEANVAVNGTELFATFCGAK